MLPHRQKELKKWEAKCAEDEELIRILDKAMALIPVTQLAQGYKWFPSDEAIAIIKFAKDRLSEWKVTR